MAKIKIIFFIIILLLIAAIYIPSISKLNELREENRALETEIKTLEKDINRLERERDRLENDPFYVEKVAREKLGMAREGEIVLEVVKE